MTRRPDGVWTWVATIKDNGFERRIKWIGECASIGGGALHHFDYVKANTSRYFFQTRYIYIPFKYAWGWGIIAQTLAFPTCYYLGSYPNYWNTQNRRIVFAHDLMTSECYAIGNKPTMMAEYLPEVDRDVLNDTINLFGVNNILDYFHPERVPAPTSIEQGELQRKLRLEIQTALADVTLFYDPFDIEQFMLQKPLLDARQKRFKDCVARTWPKPVKTYTPKPITPTATPPITSTPMNEIQIPATQIPPIPTGTPGQRIQRLTFNYGMKSDTPENILQLTIWLEETL